MLDIIPFSFDAVSFSIHVIVIGIERQLNVLTAVERFQYYIALVYVVNFCGEKRRKERERGSERMNIAHGVVCATLFQMNNEKYYFKSLTTRTGLLAITFNDIALKDGQ